MIVSAILALIGYRRGEWQAPTFILFGLIAMRINAAYIPLEYVEVTAGSIWLSVALLMLYIGRAMTGFLLTLSGLTYPVLLVFGQRIEYLGITPIIADVFLILALIWTGGGLIGLATDPNSNSDRSMDRSLDAARSLAFRKKSTW